MRTKPVYLATCLGILLVCSLLGRPLGVARGAEKIKDDVVDTEVLTTPDEEVEAVDERAINVLATVTKSCSAGASGDACLFDLTGTASGTLTVCTKATTSGQRWRTTVARVNRSGAVSRVGTGSATACTGSASRSVVRGGKYVAIVTYERPLPGTFPTSVKVRLTGPVTIAGPRRRLGDAEEIQTCQQVSESTITAAAVDVESITCGTLMMCEIDPAGDTDAFLFTATEGQVVSISITGVTSETGSGFPCWDLFGPSGAFIRSSCGQDESGPLAASGEHTIKIYTSAPPFQGPFVGEYALSLLGISESAACGTSIGFGDLKRGRIDKPGDTDAFLFTATEGQVVSISITGVTSETGSGFPCWDLFGPSGAFIRSSCGQDESGPLAASGEHTIKIYTSAPPFQGPFVGEYRLSLQLVSQ